MKNWREFYDLEGEKDIYRAGETIMKTLERHYSAFGEIINIQILNKHLPFVSFGYAIIEFSDDHVAYALILNRLDNIRFRVYVYKPTKEHLQPIQLEDNNDDFYLLPRRPIVSNARQMQSVVQVSEEKPPDQDAPSNILNVLNDDCLQQIFERLPIEDLCAVADTCKPFKINVQRISSVQFDNFTPTTDNLYHLDSLLRNFGNQIKSLSIRGHFHCRMQENLLLLTVATYCCSSNCQFEVLNISINQIQPKCYTILQPILGQLKRLRVNSRTMDCNLDSLNESKMLQVLSIRSCICNYQTLYKTLLKFPNLHQLEVQSCKLFPARDNISANGLITAEKMAFCLNKVKFLKKLTLSPSQTLCLYDSKNIFELLADAGVNIEWLIIGKPGYFRKFPLFSPGLQRLENIQILEICEFRQNIDTLLELVGNLPNLNELHLGRICLSIYNIMELAQCDTLTLLSFVLNSNEPLDPIDDVCFEELLCLVLMRTSKKKLTIQIHCRQTELLQVAPDKINALLEILEIKILPKIK